MHASFTVREALRRELQPHLQQPLRETNLDDASLERGKVRDSYAGRARRLIVTTDRASAFDRLVGTVPLKGQVLSQLSFWWFEHLEKIVPHHAVKLWHPNIMECKRCKPLPVEFVVRGYLTGVTSTSIWKHYAEGKREFCGHHLPEGLRKNDPLPCPILTPSSKAAQGKHDVSLSREALLASVDVDPALFDRASALALAIFRRGQELSTAAGLTLVDTKYEFGVDDGGELRLIDEVHTPDSSRFWLNATLHERTELGNEPDSMDKEFLRLWLMQSNARASARELPEEVRLETAARYIHVFESLTGHAFPIPKEAVSKEVDYALRVALEAQRR